VSMRSREVQDTKCLKTSSKPCPKTFLVTART
jgi:hypothetical protein